MDAVELQVENKMELNIGKKMGVEVWMEADTEVKIIAKMSPRKTKMRP